MGANFICELVKTFSSGKAQGNLFLQVLVGDLVPDLLVLAMLINQLGHGRAMISLLILDLVVEGLNKSLILLLVHMVVIQVAIEMSIEPTETNVGILELAHGASVSVDVVATLTPWFIVLKACDRFRSRMWDTTH